MVTSSCGAWAVSSFSLESKRALAVAAVRAMPLLVDGDATQPWTREVTSTAMYCSPVETGKVVNEAPGVGSVA
jgi:hypothetical protein